MKKLFRLTSPYKLSLLNNLFNKSNFDGFYLDLSKLKLETPELKDKNYRKTLSYIKSIRTVRKDLILYYDWIEFIKRPKYFDPLTFKKLVQHKKINEQEKKKLNSILIENEVKHQRLKNFADINITEDILRDIIKNYNIFLNQINSQLDLDSFLLSEIDIKSTKVLFWEFPQVPEYPKEAEHKKYYKKINKDIRKINLNFVNLRSKFKTEKLFYPIILMKNNIKQKDSVYRFYIEKALNFHNVILWVVDLNKLSPNDNFYNSYKSLLRLLAKNFDNVILKYIGIKYFHLLNRDFPNFYSILRVDGYSGRNINIPIEAKSIRTRLFLDVNDLKHKNEQNIMRYDEDKEFHCQCPVCKDNNINNYAAINYLYFSNQILRDRQYSHLFAPVKSVKNINKYRDDRRKDFQRDNRNLHCFFNCDRILNLNYKDFINQYRDIVRGWVKR